MKFLSFILLLLFVVIGTDRISAQTFTDAELQQIKKFETSIGKKAMLPVGLKEINLSADSSLDLSSGAAFIYTVKFAKNLSSDYDILAAADIPQYSQIAFDVVNKENNLTYSYIIDKPKLYKPNSTITGTVSLNGILAYEGEFVVTMDCTNHNPKHRCKDLKKCTDDNDCVF